MPDVSAWAFQCCPATGALSPVFRQLRHKAKFYSRGSINAIGATHNPNTQWPGLDTFETTIAWKRCQSRHVLFSAIVYSSEITRPFSATVNLVSYSIHC